VAGAFALAVPGWLKIEVGIEKYLSALSAKEREEIGLEFSIERIWGWLVVGVVRGIEGIIMRPELSTLALEADVEGRDMY